MKSISHYLARRLLRVFVVGLPLTFLAACGGGGGGGGATPLPVSVSVPAVPASLSMTYGVRSFSLSWAAATAPADQGAVTYRAYEDIDGTGPTAPTMIAQALSGTSYAYAIDGLLHTRVNAQYTVQACNNAGCSASTPSVAPNLTQAIGSLSPSDGEEKNLFGSSVALSADGRTLAVGAQGSNMTDTGVVRVYARASSGWVQQAILRAATPIPSERFGLSLALSADGGTLAVGSAGNPNGLWLGYDMILGVYFQARSAGMVYLFTRAGSNWAQQASVVASNGYNNDSFGASVALSGDGNTLAVGAYGEASYVTGINGSQVPGGTPFEAFQGAAYVFKRAGATWTQTTHIKPSSTTGGGSYGYFGRAVALSTSGNTLAVGAPGKDLWEGAAYVFSQTGGSWEQKAYIKESHPRADSRFRWQGNSFGNSVALSADGNTMVVGATGEQGSAIGINGNHDATGSPSALLNAGAVYVYTRTDSNWIEQAYVKASNTKKEQSFGVSVAMSADGNTLAVGAPGESSVATGINGDQASTGAQGSGAIYLFGRNGSNWAQQAYVKASNPANSFGIAVTLSSDGKDMAVGSSGGAYLY